jgi:CHC2 zinc finger
MTVPLALDARDVKSRADFVAIASRYANLRRAGRQYVGRCPFHSERHPSFYVDPERKLFKCFGCGAGGDVFAFVMRAEGCDFRWALELVALGVARESGPRSGLRVRAGVGAEPLGVAKQPGPYSQFTGSRRERILVSLRDTDRVLAAIRQTNEAHSRSLATACEPARTEASEGVCFIYHQPDNRSGKGRL